LRSSSLEGDFEGRTGILKTRLLTKDHSCTLGTQRKVVFVTQDVINVASSFNFRTSKIRTLAAVQGT
jgi:hypothetical protein